MRLSAVVLTKNEEKNIKECLRCLDFCDELIVIDDKSSDKTVELAKKYQAKIFIHPLHGDFSTQRNFGLKIARGEWVLFVDADERIGKQLQKEILNGISSQNLLEQKMRGFYIKRTDFMWGRWLRHGETKNIKLLRLARKDAGLWKGKIHEVWSIKGEIGELKNPILHYPHQTIGEFLRDINFYTDIRAQELYMQGIPVYLASIVLYPIGKFVANYLIKHGFLDGVPGFILAVIMSFHSFLVRGKLWLLWQKDQQ